MSVREELERHVRWQRLSGIAGWELDQETGRFTGSDELFALYEIDRDHGGSFEVLLDAVHPDDRDLVERTYRKARELREVCDLAYRLRFPDGRIKWVRARCHAFRDALDRPVRSIGTVQEITHRMDLEEQAGLREQMLSKTPVATVFADVDGRISFVNPAFLELWRCTDPTEPMRRRVPDLWAAPESATPLMREVVANGFWVGELVARRKNGPDFVAQIAAHALPDAEGHPRTLLLHFLDVTARVEAERALEREHQMLEKVISASPDPIFVKDGDFRYLLVNDAFAELLGHPRTAFIGRRDQDFWSRAQCEGDPAQAIEGFNAGDRRALAGEVVRCPNERATHRDGTVHLFDTIKQPLRDSSGNVVAMLGYSHDITDRVHASDRIAAQLAQKELLLRELHHRVKNNLQIVSSLLHLQETSGEAKSLGEALADSRRRISAMSLIHELLYAAGAPSDINVYVYAEALVRSLARSFGVNGPERRMEVCGDSFSLELDRAIVCGLVLNELLTNTFKHAFPLGRRGTVTIALSKGESSYAITVRDDGIGMPANGADQAGLGLRLLPRLAAQLDGELTRDPVEGTSFTLRIPHRSPGR